MMEDGRVNYRGGPHLSPVENNGLWEGGGGGEECVGTRKVIEVMITTDRSDQQGEGGGGKGMCGKDEGDGGMK